MSHYDTGIEPSKTLAEHRARQAKCFDFDSLKDGERKMLITPAFDLRNTADKQYGQHSAALTFAERRGDRVVSTEFFTGGECWGELGSSLYGDVLLDRLVHEGSAGIWDELDKEFKRSEETE